MVLLIGGPNDLCWSYVVMVGTLQITANSVVSCSLQTVFLPSFATIDVSEVLVG